MDEYNLDGLLYTVRLIYEYKCEQFDAVIVELKFGELMLGIDGCVFLPDLHTRSVSMENAIMWSRWVDKLLYNLKVDKLYYIKTTKNVARLTYEGLVREYKNIPKELFDKIEKLGGVKL